MSMINRKKRSPNTMPGAVADDEPPSEDTPLVVDIEEGLEAAQLRPIKEGNTKVS